VPQHIIYVRAETQVDEGLIVEIDVCHKPLLKTGEFLLLLRYVDYRGVYGGGVDERVDRRGGTGGSSVRP
jgi:hypothetical protein